MQLERQGTHVHYAYFPVKTFAFFFCAEPSADELRRLMMLHGGQFHMYYSHTKTTHIIATNLPNCKIKELRGEKVVRPEWITDRYVCVLFFFFSFFWYLNSQVHLGTCLGFKNNLKSLSPNRDSV